MLIPLVPAAVIALALIVAQPDLGQTVSLGIILLGLLGTRASAAGVPVLTGRGRVVGGWCWRWPRATAPRACSPGLNPGADAQGSGYQARQARFALANGGVFGDGLGQGSANGTTCPTPTTTSSSRSSARNSDSSAPWGCLCLFGLFAYTGMRIARRSVDPFLRLLTATATLWIMGQVFINVGYVVGLLPVTGLQLPLISAGGTSTATTLLMIGIMANAARHEPEAVAALRAGRDDRVNRLLRLPPPAPYVPSRTEALRDRLRTRPDKPPAKAARKPDPEARQRQPGANPIRSIGRCDAQGIMEAAEIRTADGHVPWKVSVTGEYLGPPGAGA